jgi:predicted metal-dependent phosphoesterase TrpH
VIDLHAHSSASDGTLCPADLVSLARRAGLTALALTDHDTIAGLPEAIDAARDTAIQLVPGVELSAACERGAIHIVGLHVDHEHPALLDGLSRARRMREIRNPRIVERLTAIGKPLELAEVARIAGGAVIGRPHFAAAMVARGYVSSADRAFESYLGRNGAAYVPKEKLTPATCIDLIRQAGGVPVLAHPDQTELAGEELHALVGDLARDGLAGIEVYCPTYSHTTTREYRKIALEYDLVESGGSDFHGSTKPRIKLGRGFGRLRVPDELLERIAETADAIRKGTR